MKDGEMKDGEMKDGEMKDGEMKDGEMKDWDKMLASGPVATCDICGGGVVEEERVDAALTLGGVMCPTPMTFHRSCHEAAQAMLGSASDSLFCEAPAEDERGLEIARLLDQIPVSPAE